jgi:peptide/nickel transport system substrate-binding protein
MKKQYLLNLLLVIVALALVVSACGPAATEAPAEPEPTEAAAAPEPTEAPAEPAPTEAPTEPPAAEKKVLRVAYGSEIDTLNALTSQNLTDIEITMIDGLIMSDDNNSYIPVLAKEIPTTENGGIVMLDDGKVEMTWHLYEGVQWHDGVEFTSDDVCFTWEFIVSDAGAAVYNQTEYQNIIDCQAPDPYTVVFTWADVYAPYASLFDTILPKHFLEGQDILTYDAYNRSPLGTGPFVFAEWKSGEYVRVVKNENYWRGSDYPKLDEIIFTFIPDPNTRLNALKASEHDLGEILPAQVAEVEGLEGYKTDIVNSNIWVYFGTNVATERGQMLFGDKNVRHALSYGFDRESIAVDLMEGTVSVADTPITPSSPYHNPDVPKYRYDPEKAMQMLEDAGWTVGDDGIRVKDGERFSFAIMNRMSRPERVAIAQVIQAQLKDIGVEVVFEDMENAAWIEKWLSTEWDAIVGGWIIPADPSLTSLYACDASNNFTGYCFEDLDEAMHASDGVFDFADRKPLMDEVQAILQDEVPQLPIYYQPRPYVLREDFENFKGSGTNLGSFWNSYEWDFGN